MSTIVIMTSCQCLRSENHERNAFYSNLLSENFLFKEWLHVYVLMFQLVRPAALSKRQSFSIED